MLTVSGDLFAFQGSGLSLQLDGSQHLLQISAGTITSITQIVGGLPATTISNLSMLGTGFVPFLLMPYGAQLASLLGGHDVIRGTDAHVVDIPGVGLMPGGDLLYGFSGRDTIHGYDGSDTLLGGNGNDWLYGGRGNDFLIDETGHDKLYGGEGRDTLIGGSGSDGLYGGRGSDVMAGGSWNDTYNGGAGFDIAILLNSRNHTVDLSKTGTQNTGEGSDQFVSIEGVVTGDGDDQLSGDPNDNFLYSGNNRDVLSGGAGNDTLIGGKGRDMLTGGADADVFVFTEALDPSRNVDTVSDFVSGEDIFLLDRKFFANGPAKLPGETTAVFGADSFHVGTAATTADHRIIYDDVTGKLYYDKDGTGSATMKLFANLAPHTALEASDFHIGPGFATLYDLSAFSMA